MAKRRTANRLDKRREAEAAEYLEGDSAPEGEEKPAAKPKAKKARAKSTKTASRKRKSGKAGNARLRMVWGVFDNGNQQVGAFPYGERDAAEARAAELAEKNKKLYFVQPVKEVIGGGDPTVAAEEPEVEEVEEELVEAEAEPEAEEADDEYDVLDDDDEDE